jgi:hypothetical protein
MNEARRYALDMSRLIPRWVVVVWDLLIVLIMTVNTVVLALQLNPASLLFPALGIVMIGIGHFMVRGLRNPDWNFVELTKDSLQVSISLLVKPFMVEFSYGALVKVELHGRHRLWQGLLWFWPYYPTRDHVDVRLRRSQFIFVGWGRFLWVKTVHLQVMEPERFAAALRERLAGRGLPETHGP